jgi:hypothetical protein
MRYTLRVRLLLPLVALPAAACVDYGVHRFVKDTSVPPVDTTETADPVVETSEPQETAVIDTGDGTWEVAKNEPVAVVATLALQEQSTAYECEGQPGMTREFEQITRHLTDIGLRVVQVYEDPSVGVDYDDISMYNLVIYSTGGYTDSGARDTATALQTAAEAGQGILFIGDDVASQAENYRTERGDDTIANLAGVGEWTSSGSDGAGVTLDDTTHAVVNGPWGAVGSFGYDKDADDFEAAGAGEVVLMEVAATGAPAVIALEEGRSRRVLMGVGIYTSGKACPIAEQASLDEIEILFKNAVYWAGHWYGG